MGIIYVIRNLVNGKVYVGKTVQCLDSYFKGNLVAAENGSTRKPLLYRAIRKHGSSDFSVEQIDHTDDPTALSELEKFWIAKLCSCDPNIGYNLTTGGTGGAMVGEAREKLRRPKSKEHREKISILASIRGTSHMNTPEARAKKGLKLRGRVFSQEAIERMRAAAKRRGASPEWKASHSAKTKGLARNRDGNGRFTSKNTVSSGDPTGTERSAS